MKPIIDAVSLIFQFGISKASGHGYRRYLSYAGVAFRPLTSNYRTYWDGFHPANN